MATDLVPVSTPLLPARPGDLIASWLASRKPSTIAAYTKSLNDFADFLRNHWPGGFDRSQALEQFLGLAVGEANAVVLAYRDAQLARGLASATIAQRLAAIRSLVKRARMIGRIEWSIEVESPRHEAKCDRSGPDESEWKKLVRAAKKLGNSPRAKRDRAIVYLGYGLALRRFEITGIDYPADVDFAAGKIEILGKGRREKISLDAPREIMSAIGEWAHVRPAGDGPLFTRTDRACSLDRLSGESVRRLVLRLAIAAGLTKPVRPHGLRHASITHLLASGETVTDVRAFSRHQSIETVVKYYDRSEETGARLAKRASKTLS